MRYYRCDRCKVEMKKVEIAVAYGEKDKKAIGGIKYRMYQLCKDCKLNLKEWLDKK